MADDPDVLKVLVASDMHLGYGERDPIRGDDSFVTFGEVFQIALEQQVDMVLLAGDLFHDNKPSRKALQRAMEILRDYCLGDRKVQIEVVSDQQANFHNKYHAVNYEDPHYNVQLPVFSIHGNHDDPAGDGGLAALDLLSTANLINYFGRAENFEKICLSPVLIQKGRTKLALYGLGHIRDERLNRCFERKEVKVARPVEDRDEWFSLLALHQNRLPRGAGLHAKGYIREEQLPSCLDLVVWGHEHECLIGGGMGALPESVGNDFVVMQPGSTVATALVEGEARPKHVALLAIRGDAWQMRPIPLTTVRPFIIREVALREHDDDYDLHQEEGLMSFLADQVEDMLQELRARQTATPLTEDAENRAKFPLVRLKVDYGGYSTCNPQKFGQRFVDRVANPGEILLFQKTKVRRREEKAAQDAAKRQAGASSGLPPLPDVEDPTVELQDLVGDFLRDGKDGLRLLPTHELNSAVFVDFVAKDNRNAIRNQVEATLKKTQAFLASEARTAVDGAALDRRMQHEAIEQQIDVLVQRGTEAHRATVQSGVLPMTDCPSLQPAGEAEPASCTTPVPPDEAARWAPLDETAVATDPHPHSNLETRRLAGADHLFEPTRSGAGAGDHSLDARRSEAAAIQAPVSVVGGVPECSTSHAAPSTPLDGRSRLSPSARGGASIASSRTLQSASRQGSASRTPSDAGHMPHGSAGGGRSPTSRVAPLSVSGGANRLSSGRLDFNTDGENVRLKAKAASRVQLAADTGRRTSLVYRRDEDEADLVESQESQDQQQASGRAAAPATESSIAGSRASSFASRRRQR